MTRADTSVRVRGMVQALRRRVRLRTRLRRARTAIRNAVPRRLPAWSAAPSAVAREHDRTEIAVASVGGLRRTFEGEARSVRVVVTHWRAPHPGWSGRLGALPGLRRLQVDLPDGSGSATVTVSLADPLPLWQVVAAVHRILEPLPPSVVAGQMRVGAVPGPGGAGPEHPGVTVDAGAANPRGRQRYGSSLPDGELVLDGEQWQVERVPDGVPVVAGRVGAPLDDHQRSVLAELGLVTSPRYTRQPPRRSRRSSTGEAPSEQELLLDRREAVVLVQLAATGVVVHLPDRPEPAGQAAGLLAGELAGILTCPLPGNDPMRWEARSVRQRRAALRHHAAGLAGTGPSVTALLVSKRPELAAAQVAALASQTYPQLEIVVAMHGCPEPPGLREAAAGRPIQVVTVPVERNLGQALQAATGAAGGELVTKVDDDDRYGPEHVWDLVLAHHYSGATVVGKGAELVYVAPKDLTVRRRMGAELFTDTIAGGTIALPRAELAATGGWPALPRHVDRALLDQVLAAGGLVYRTHPLHFIYTRHGDGHTWQADLDYFLHDIQRRWPGLPSHDELGAG